MNDDTVARIDYKYAEYKETLYKPHKYQSALYGLLIMDNYSVEVRRGFVCYTRSNHHVEEIPFKQSDFERAKVIIFEILNIIKNGYYPKGTKQKSRCIDCTYRNICD